MRVSEVFEQQFPYRSFYSWDTDALRNPAQAHSCDRYGQANKKRKKRVYHSDGWYGQQRNVNLKS